MAFGVILIVDVVVSKVWRGSAPRTLHIVGAIAALGLTFVMANAYFVSAGIPAWASWQTFLLFILGNLAMGAALLTLFEPSLAKNGTYLITAAALGVLAIVAIALEAVHFAGVGANMILLAIGAVVVAAAAMLQSMAKIGQDGAEDRCPGRVSLRIHRRRPGSLRFLRCVRSVR